MEYTSEGKNWCMRFDHVIDYSLVKGIAPSCIEKNNGCANCEHSKYVLIEKQSLFREEAAKKTR